MAALFRARAALWLAAVTSLVGMTAGPASGASAFDARAETLERAVVDNPEDLRSGADYRQYVIHLGAYDRAIKTLERLADRPDAGPHAYINLALAYVDHIPEVSVIRRVFLGRRAMRALSRAIERQPSLLATLVAYYIRGLVALYYPEGLFHEARKGIADLEHARDMLAGLAVEPYHALVYVALGDGYWKLHDGTRALAVWNDGLTRFSGNTALHERLMSEGKDRDRIVDHALDSGVRVDTSLHELFPPDPAL